MMRVLISLMITFAILTGISGCAYQTVANEEIATQKSSVPEEVCTPTEDTVSEVQYEILSSRAKVWKELEGSEYEYGQINVVVEFVNTGKCDLFLSNSTYDLENAEGKLVSAQNLIFAFPEILAPGEKGYLSIIDDYDGPLESDLVVVPRIDAEKSAFDCIRYEVSDLSMDMNERESVVTLGRVENTGTLTPEKTYIFVALYDAEGTCIETDLGSIKKLSPGEKAGFETIGTFSPDVTIDDVADMVCYAYPIQGR